MRTLGAPRRRRLAALATTLALAAGGVAAVAPATPAVAVEPGADPFFTYRGSAPLASRAPGDVLDTRTRAIAVLGLPLPVVTVVQVLYRSTDQLGRPVANVTTVFPSSGLGPGAGKAVAYGSFYDSLNPADSPSRALSGGTSPGGAVNYAEVPIFASFVAQGYAVVVTDTEGPDADFAAGPEYGRLTLDALRAVSSVPATGLGASAPVGLMGYSGGAIATGWAAALAPSYAPDVDRRIVGATEGGVLVAPARNLRYIDGTPVWAGVTGMALVGIARAFDIDFSAYLSDRGREVFVKLENASISQVLGQYPGLTFASLVKPQYADPRSIPEFVAAANAVNLGLAPAPTVPMHVRQGTGGDLEGTPGNRPGIGPGDGVMVAGDVRSLARQYCAAGTPVDHAEYPGLSHLPAAVPWAAEASLWLVGRFAGGPVTSTCGSIAPGNPLDPEVGVAPAAVPGTGARQATRTRLRQKGTAPGARRAVTVRVVAGTASAGRAGRAVVRLDGRVLRKVTVPVRAKGAFGPGRRVAVVRLPRDLGRGTHRVRAVFKPTDAGFARSRSEVVRVRVR